MMRGFNGVLAGLSQGYCQRFQIRNLKMMESNWIPASQPAQVPRSILIPQWHIPLYPKSFRMWLMPTKPVQKKPKKETMSRGNIWKGTWWKCTLQNVGPNVWPASSDQGWSCPRTFSKIRNLTSSSVEIYVIDRACYFEALSTVTIISSCGCWWFQPTFRRNIICEIHHQRKGPLNQTLPNWRLEKQFHAEIA